MTSVDIRSIGHSGCSVRFRTPAQPSLFPVRQTSLLHVTYTSTWHSATERVWFFLFFMLIFMYLFFKRIHSNNNVFEGKFMMFDLHMCLRYISGTLNKLNIYFPHFISILFEIRILWQRNFSPASLPIFLSAMFYQSRDNTWSRDILFGGDECTASSFQEVGQVKT